MSIAIGKNAKALVGAALALGDNAHASGTGDGEIATGVLRVGTDADTSTTLELRDSTGTAHALHVDESGNFFPTAAGGVVMHSAYFGADEDGPVTGDFTWEVPAGMSFFRIVGNYPGQGGQGGCASDKDHQVNDPNYPGQEIPVAWGSAAGGTGGRYFDTGWQAFSDWPDDLPPGAIANIHIAAGTTGGAGGVTTDGTLVMGDVADEPDTDPIFVCGSFTDQVGVPGGTVQPSFGLGYLPRLPATLLDALTIVPNLAYVQAYNDNTGDVTVGIDGGAPHASDGGGSVAPYWYDPNVSNAGVVPWSSTFSSFLGQLAGGNPGFAYDYTLPGAQPPPTPDGEGAVSGYAGGGGSGWSAINTNGGPYYSGGQGGPGGQAQLLIIWY